MDRDFDDFHDDYDHIRQQHYQSLDEDQYGDYYNPNSEHFYDLDACSLEHAKSLFYGLGDIARYKGFNRVGEDIPIEEYFDESGNSITLPQDAAHSLYHLNNQTILDASTMPDQPVDPQKFLVKVIAELTSKNVLISTDMPGLLERMCRLFNYSIKPNSELPRTVKNLVFPAQTGTGKSVSVQVYVSLLTSHSSILVVSKVEEAINYCNYINSLSADNDYARCYYSLTDKNKSDPMRVDAAHLRNYRCIVITHNMFRRVIIEAAKTSGNPGSVESNSYVSDISITEYFGTFEGRARDFVSIDEKLSFHERYRLNYDDLDSLIANVTDAIRQSEQLNELTNSQEALDALELFKGFLLVMDDKIVTNDQSVVVRAPLDQKSKSDLGAIGQSINYSAYSYPKEGLVKLVGIKNKDQVVSIFNSNHVGTQARKRRVIGVSHKHLVSKEVGRFGALDPFYCERFEPPIGNCMSAEEKKTYEPDESIFNRVLSAKEVEDLIAMQDCLNEQSGLQLAVSVLRVMLKTRVDELTSSLEALGAKKNSHHKQNTINAINELLDTLQYFSLNDFLIYKTNQETSLVATENLTNELGLSVVLDATAQINQYYKLANRFFGHVGFVAAPQIRKYNNLTINKASGFKQSRAALYKGKSKEDVKAIASSYASYVINELEDGDKMLVICHKDFKRDLSKEIKDTRVEFTHWGNHVGRNDWSHCNKVMLIGWYYLNQIEYVSTINASLDSILLTSRHLDDEVIKDFEISQLADDMVQGLMRSRARIITTPESDCKITNFYLFYPDDEKSREVIDLVISQFPEANVIDWTPNGAALPVKKTKATKRADRIIEMLIGKAKDYETCLRSDIESELGINKTTMTRVLASDYMQALLNEHGFSYKNKDGKSMQFILS